MPFKQKWASYYLAIEEFAISTFSSMGTNGQGIFELFLSEILLDVETKEAVSQTMYLLPKYFCETDKQGGTHIFSTMELTHVARQQRNTFSNSTLITANLCLRSTYIGCVSSVFASISSFRYICGTVFSYKCTILLTENISIHSGCTI
jgi:GH24 family phage-related lysozyme (muramidase)